MNSGWQEVKLSECLTIKHGKSQKEVESANGLYPILGTGGQIGRTDDFLCNKPSVLIGRKGTIDKPRYMDTPFWTVDTLFYTDIRDNAVAKYIYYIFTTINWYQYNEASGVPSLSASTISNIKIKLPPKTEQLKIVKILESWDKYLETLDKKIATKKNIKNGLMQQLLSGKARIPGFNGDWRETKLGDICSISTGKKDVNQGNPKGKYPFFTCSRKHTYSDVFSYDFEAILVAGNADVGHCKYYKGKFEAYQRTYILSDFVSTNGKYLFYFLNYFFKNQIESLKQIGAMSYIKLPMLQEFLVSMPSLAEQQAIVQLLDVASSEIAELERVLQLAKEQHKYLLSSLLSGKVKVGEVKNLEIQHA